VHGRCLGAVRALFGCGRSFGAGALGAARAPGVRSGLAKGGLFRYGCGVQYFPTGRRVCHRIQQQSESMLRERNLLDERSNISANLCKENQIKYLVGPSFPRKYCCSRLQRPSRFVDFIVDLLFVLSTCPYSPKSCT
jgi:hypothetical protein